MVPERRTLCPTEELVGRVAVAVLHVVVAVVALHVVLAVAIEDNL